MSSSTEELKRAIVAALEGRRWAEALPLLEAWCALHPRHAKSWLNRGYCLLQLGRCNEAVAALDHCLELDPAQASAAAWRRRALEALDRAHTVAGEGEAAQATGAAPMSFGATAPHAGGMSQAPPSFATMAIPGAQMAWQAGTVIDGRYEVRKTARGGMAMVAIAFDRELRRMVAIKTPLPSVLASADGRARFQREAESWIALGVHPNICCAHYLQEIGGMPRLFIEYVDGGDLSTWLKAARPRTFEERLDVAIQIAGGLDYTHTFEWSDDEGRRHRGLVHRDIKPANVLMSLDGIARVTDFGLVRAHSGDDPAREDLRAQIEPRMPAGASLQESFASGSWQTVTAAGGLVGTPPYMAPELWRAAQKGTVLSDVYAYGCLLYELFCGRRPFVMSGDAASRTREDHLGGLMRLHLREAPPDPRALAEGISGPLAELMLGCLHKKPAARPQSFSELRAALTEVYAEATGRPYPRPEPRRTQLLADSLNNRGASFVSLGLEERAAASFREALAAAPGHLEATYNASLLEWRREGLTDAELERRLDEAERAARGSGQPALLRAQLRLLLDNPWAALASLDADGEASSSLAGRRLRAQALLALARTKRSQDTAAEAAEMLQEVVLESRSDTAALLALAEASHIAGDDGLRDQAVAAARSLDRGLPEDLGAAVAAHLPGRQVARVLEHKAAVACLDLAEGTRLVVRTADDEAVVWDLEAERVLVRVELAGPARPGRSLAVSGGTLAVCGEDAPITLYDLRDGSRRRSFRTHPGVATCVHIDAGGGRVASGGSDRCVRLWRTADGDCERTLAGHEAFISAVAWHPDGQRLLSASADGAARLWGTDGSCLAVLSGHRGPLCAVALSGDGRLAFTGAEDGTVAVWELAGGHHLRWLRGHDGSVTALASCGDLVAGGGTDGTVRLWRADDGELVRLLRLPTPVHDLTFTAAGALLAAHGTVVTQLELPVVSALRLPLVLADSAASGELAQREQEFSSWLEEARGLIAERRMVEAIPALRAARAVPGYDLHRRALDLWSEVLAFFPRGAPRTVLELEHFEGEGGGLSGCALAADAGAVFVADRRGAVRRYERGCEDAAPTVTAHGQGGVALALSGDGRQLASAGRDGVLRILRAEDGHEELHFEGGAGALRAVVFAPGDDGVITAGDDGAVRLWRLDHSARPEIIGSSAEAVAALAVSADGRFLAGGGWDSIVTVWSLRGRTELHRLEGHQGAVLALAVSPDCRLCVSAGSDGTIRLWDLERGVCVRELTGHEGAVQAVAFTPDGRWLLSAGDDASIRLWDPRSGRVAIAVRGHAGSVTGLALSRDGGIAASAGDDGDVRLWFLDWEPVVPEGSWDDRVVPLLEAFLRRREGLSSAGGVPTWSAHDLGRLLDDLQYRGFGWLAPNAVEQALERLARQRSERRVEEQERARQLARRSERRLRAAPARELLAGLGRNLGLRTAAVAAAAVVVLALLWSLTTPGGGAVGFSDLYREIGLVAQARGMRLEKGTVHAYQSSPSLGSVNCGEEAFADLVQLAVDAESGSPQRDPGRPADPGFQRRYANAVNCVGRLGDDSVVEPILRRARLGIHPKRVEDLAGILVRVDAAGSAELRSALTDAAESARHLAALALFYGDGDRGAQLLLAALRGDDGRGAEAASSILLELLCAGAIPEDQAFEPVRRLSRSIDPAVRRNAVRALVIFEEKEPMVEVLEAALADADPAVVEAALTVRDTLDRAR